MDKSVKSKQEVEGLLFHNLPVNSPSQLSDAFILGMRHERKLCTVSEPVNDEDFGEYAALAMLFFADDVKDIHDDLKKKGWDSQQATFHIDHMRALFHKHVNELKPLMYALNAAKMPEKKKVEFSCTVCWVETIYGRKMPQVSVPPSYEKEYGDLIRNRAEVTGSDLDEAIRRSGQTLIPAHIDYGMVLEFVNKDNPVLVGWRLAHMGSGGNTILAVSQ